MVSYKALNTIQKESSFSYVGPHKILVMLTIPLGFVAYMYYQNKMKMK